MMIEYRLIIDRRIQLECPGVFSEAACYLKQLAICWSHRKPPVALIALRLDKMMERL
jgi:hypothetical protein